MKKFLAVWMLLFLVSCASSVQDATNPEPDTNPEPAAVSHTHPADASIPLGRFAIVAATDWTDPIGSLASLDTSAGYAAATALVSTDGSDVVLKSFFDKIYVINRYGADTIQVVDPAGYGIVKDYSVGAGSNPQDIWVVSEEKAYVSRLDAQNDASNKDDILIVNPLTGEIKGSIDFKSYMYDDGDKLSRAGQMVAVGKKLFVCLQDLPSNLLDPANADGKVGVIDTDTDEILDVIDLAGRNPGDITYSPLTKLIYVSDSGVFNSFVTDVNDPYGGIEVIDPETFESKGIVVDDKDLGGYTQAIRLASDSVGYVIVGGLMIASFNPTSYEVLNKAFYTSAGFYLPDFSVDGSGNVYVAETAMGGTGVVVLDGAGSTLAGPIPVGAPPSSITFAGYEGE